MHAYPGHSLLISFYIAANALPLTQASAWTPGVYTSPMPSKGFTVDVNNRNDVLSFWHAIYQASEGYQDRIGWTGSYTASDFDIGAGTTSDIFVRDVERRINFFRALAGAPANASVNTGSKVVIFTNDVPKPDPSTLKSYAARRSAYMIARGYINFQESSAISHNPPNNVITWSNAAWNGNARSNITYGYFGPGAVNAYIKEDEKGTTETGISVWNSSVGHRRWLLNASATDFATGDTPGQYQPSTGITPPTNALYVIQHDSETVAAPSEFTSYPAAGFFPAGLNTPFWSLSHPYGVFTAATVQVRNANNELVNVTKINQNTAYGDPTLVWEVKDAAALATQVSSDRVFHVQVTGIGSAPGHQLPASHSYTVRLINPDILTSDQSLIGTDSPPVSATAKYVFSRPDHSEEIQINAFRNSPADWIENANTTTHIIDRTYSNYSLVSGTINGFTPISGSSSFRLTHPVRYDSVLGVSPEQIFEIDREILTIPGQTSSLRFSYKRGYMYSASSLAAEYSNNGGATWNTLGNPITGAVASGPTSVDGSATVWTATLPPSSDPYRIRFRFYKNQPVGDTFNHTDSNMQGQPSGIFIDDISTTNCRWLEPLKTNTVPADQDHFIFDAAAVSTQTPPPALVPNTPYLLRMRTKIGGRWFPHGPSKILTPTNTPHPGFAGWMAYEYPQLEGGFTGSHAGDGIPNGVKFGFHLDPTQKYHLTDTLSLSSSPARNATGPVISISRPANGLRDHVSAEWSDTLAPGSWSSEGVTLHYADGTASATAPAGTGRRFLRWKVTE